MSLMASGIPHSAGELLDLMRRSASAACSSACLSVTVMNALSFPSTAAIRSRHARVSSTAEISRRRSRSAASEIVSRLSSEDDAIVVRLSFDDLRHFEVAALVSRCIREHFFGRRMIGHRVVAHGYSRVADLSRRLDVLGLKLAELLDIAEHLVHVRAELGLLLGCQAYPRQERDMPHLLERNLAVCHRPGIVTSPAFRVRACFACGLFRRGLASVFSVISQRWGSAYNMMRRGTISDRIGAWLDGLRTRFSSRGSVGMSRFALGRHGEYLAERHLRHQGFRIVARNFRAAGAEIDLVAMDHDTLVFVEVKRRSSDAAGTPEEAVDRHKRDQIRRAAESFVRRYRAEGRMMRFDVIAISGAGRRPHLEHLRDAF